VTQPPATLRGAVDLPPTPVRYRRTLDDQLATPTRVSPIQLAPEPAAPADPASQRRTRSSVFATAASNIGNPSGIVARSGGHPHAKPLDVMEQMLEMCPPGVVADPFAGSGSTLVAARNLGRRAVGVELEERYCEMAARRLAQDCFELGATS